MSAAAATPRGFALAGRHIAPGEPVFVIAEAGVNHNGRLDLALGLVDAAAAAGADAVKFQTFRAESLITQRAPKAQYHIVTTGDDSVQTWFELLKTQEMSPEMHEKVIQRCREKNIVFLSTPYDDESVDLLDRLNVPLFKVASTDANNIPFLERMASKKRPIILSTAMCEIAEVEASVQAIRATGLDDLVVMQCTGSYPAPVGDANLKAMAHIEQRCRVAVGYSDHVPGPTAAIAAIALGACAYEKHLTLDRTLPGPDHRASMHPDELGALISAIRDVEAALGDGIKRVMPCEVENRNRLRKNVVAARDLPSGHVLTCGDLTAKRTGGIGLLPAHLSWAVGKTLQASVSRDEAITTDMIR